jgi:hypothetical protein
MAATVEYECPPTIDTLYQLVLMAHVDPELFFTAATALVGACLTTALPPGVQVVLA